MYRYCCPAFVLMLAYGVLSVAYPAQASSRSPPPPIVLAMSAGAGIVDVATSCTDAAR